MESRGYDDISIIALKGDLCGGRGYDRQPEPGGECRGVVARVSDGRTVWVRRHSASLVRMQGTMADDQIKSEQPRGSLPHSDNEIPPTIGHLFGTHRSAYVFR